MSLEESSSEWMRIKKFLAHTARETGQRLGWSEVALHTENQDLRIQFANLPDNGVADHQKGTYYSKLFHTDGWYRNDEQGAHLVSYGNGANYLPHGYPSIAGVLFFAFGDARSIIVPGAKVKRTARKKRQNEPTDILTQSRYQHGIVLYGLADGVLTLSDEHPFYPATLLFLQTHLNTYRRVIDHALPGVVFPEDQKVARVQEFQYHQEFVPLLAEHLVTQVICSTEGTLIRQEPVLRLVTSTQ
ncbi:MAG: hypothetical protein AAB400_01565 [Patescibacteria group bacterium]